MGTKISKVDNKVIEQRFNELRSMASDVSNFIDNYEGDNSSQRSSRKIPESNKDSSKPAGGLFVSHKLSLVMRESEPLSEYNKGSERDLETSKAKSPKGKKLSEIMMLDNIDFQNLDPLTPNSLLKQSKGRIEDEIKHTLQALIAKQQPNLANIKVYLHSEIPLDDEKPMEEKSCKIEDRSKNQGFGDYESPVRNLHHHHNLMSEEAAWDVYENSKQHFYELGIAVTCRKGEVVDVPNQDNYFIYVDPYTKVYSVYDGHGPFGNLVSHFVCLQLARALLEGPIYLIDPVAAMKEAFSKAELALRTYVHKKDPVFDTHLSGTSATVVLQRSNVIYIGQLGDSKVMIGRKNKSKKGMTLEQLTYDHVPYSLEEKKRIYAKGGEVRVWDENGDERVFAKGRVYPCLATTRAIGDEIGSLIGIISEPEICTVEINPPTDVFLLIGSSSVFTYLDDNEILNVMNYANVSKIRETVDILVKKAKNAWIHNENTVDDLTLIITYL